MRRIPIGDWSDLTSPTKRYISIEVVDGFGHTTSVMIEDGDSDGYWGAVYRIADWLGFGMDDE